MAQVENLKIGNTSYGITDANTLPALNATTRAQLLLDGTYLGSAVENGKVFESDTGKFEQFSKTPGSPTFTWSDGTLPSAQYWKSTAYGNGTYVVISGSSSNSAAYSTDGATWTAATMPALRNWSSVTYGSDKFVAVANGSDKAAYSTNGITWTEMSMPRSASWSSVAYGNGTFVAMPGNNGKAAYSTNGTTWTEMSMPASVTWYAVTYGNGKFVAVSNNARFAAYSSDGVTWSSTTLPVSSYWMSVVFGKDKFVAVSRSNGYAAYSTDGATWTSVSLGSTAAFYSIAYGEDLFVVVADSNNTFWYSPDGLTWSSSTLTRSSDWANVVYYNAKFMAVTYGTKIAVGSVQTPYTYALTELNPSLKNTATGSNSLTIGGTATASGQATNVGLNSGAGPYSTSLGSGANANGSGAVSVGYAATANQMDTVAIGVSSQATAKGAIALGANARNSETKTFKVALTDSTTAATDEASGLYTLLKSDGKIPVDRLENVNKLSTGNIPSITTAANYRSQLLLDNAVGSRNDLWYCNTITQDSINGTVTGKLLRNGAYVSGFSNSSYINTNTTLASTDTYELLLKLRLDYFVAGSASQAFLSDASAAYLFMFSNAKKMQGYNNGAYFNGTYVYDNNWHWLKIKWDGTNLTASYLKDASQTYQIDTLPTEGWTTDITTATNIFSGKTLCLGNKPAGVQPYAGSFDLKGCQFIKNGSVVWTGTVNNGTTEYFWRSPLYSTNNTASVQVGGLVQGTNDVVIGDKARTTSDTSVVIGNNAWSGSTGATTNNVVIGYGAKASASYSVTIGQNANGSATGGTAVGTATTVSGGYNPVAIGYGSQATAGGAIMLGYGTNNETNTLKVALTNTSTRATNESTGLFTLLKADGKIPAGRLGTLPTADGTYTLTLTVTGGVPVLSFTAV